MQSVLAVCLFSPKLKYLYFVFQRGLGRLESKNRTICERKSDMSSLDPSIICFYSFNGRTCVPLPFSNYFWYPFKSNPYRPRSAEPVVEGTGTGSGTGTGTTCHWLLAKITFMVIKSSLSFYKRHCSKKSLLAQI